MEPKKKIGIAIGIGLVVGVAILVTRHSIKKKGYSQSKTFSKMFDVPYLKEKFDETKYQDPQEQNENEQTSEGIEFRADGSTPTAQKITKSDTCLGRCVAPKVCRKGVCQLF